MDKSGSASEFDEYIGRTRLAEDLITPQLIERFRACFEPHLAPAAVVAVAPSLRIGAWRPTSPPPARWAATATRPRGNFCRPSPCRAGCGPAAKSRPSMG